MFVIIFLCNTTGMLNKKALQFASKMQSKLYQKCMQNGAEIVCKNSVQIVLQKLHFLCIKKGVVK